MYMYEIEEVSTHNSDKYQTVLGTFSKVHVCSLYNGFIEIYLCER